MNAWHACIHDMHAYMTCMHTWRACIHDVHAYMTCMHTWHVQNIISLLGHFGVALGSLWCHFGIILSMLGSLWDHFGVVLDHSGIVLRSFWGHFGIILGSFWYRFGIFLGSLWDHFRIVLESFWDRSEVVLGSRWDHLGLPLGSSGVVRSSGKQGKSRLLGLFRMAMRVNRDHDTQKAELNDTWQTCCPNIRNEFWRRSGTRLRCIAKKGPTVPTWSEPYTLHEYMYLSIDTFTSEFLGTSLPETLRIHLQLNPALSWPDPPGNKYQTHLSARPTLPTRFTDQLHCSKLSHRPDSLTHCPDQPYRPNLLTNLTVRPYFARRWPDPPDDRTHWTLSL